MMTIRAHNATTLTGRNSSAPSLVSWALGLVRQRAARRREIADYRMLLEVDDFTLSDIGVTRADVADLLAAAEGR